MRTLVAVLASATVFLTASAAAQAHPGPEELIKQTTNKVLAELTANRGALENDTQKLYQMVGDLVLPHFNFQYMARLVLGKHWRRADDTQKNRFVGEFRTLLVRTYSIALFKYTGQKIVYKPFHIKEGGEKATVRTEIENADGGPSIPFNYFLSQQENGAWMVYDISVDGISLVTNYRSSYNSFIQKKGLDGLINALAEKNKAPIDG